MFTTACEYSDHVEKTKEFAIKFWLNIELKIKQINQPDGFAKVFNMVVDRVLLKKVCGS